MSRRGKIAFPYSMIFDVYDGYRGDPESGIVFGTVLNDDQMDGLEYALKMVGGRWEQMLNLYYRDGLSYQTIGDMYGLTRERVRTIVLRGLRRLRTWMPYVKYGYSVMEERKNAVSTIKDEEITMDSEFYDLGLSTRSCNCLRRAGIRTIGQVVNMTREDLMGIKNLGVVCADEIEDAVEKFLARSA